MTSKYEHAYSLLRARKATRIGWAKWAISAAKQRAKKYGLEINITPEDLSIPEKCPALGIPLVLGQTKGWAGRDHSPSIDRLDSSKGYIKGNVRVISARANFLKNNATIQELEGVIAYMKAATAEGSSNDK